MCALFIQGWYYNLGGIFYVNVAFRHDMTLLINNNYVKHCFAEQQYIAT